MSARTIMPLIIFLLAFIAAIVIGDLAITKIGGIPASEAPKIVRAAVHFVTLGLVFFLGVKVFPKPR